MKKLLVLINVLFCLQYGFSQSDFREAYIISNDGDTINGLIDYREGNKNFEVCEFKNSIKSNSIKYTPTEIKAYQFINDKYFESGKIESDEASVFMEVLVRGKAVLYRHLKKYYIAKDTLFFELKNERQQVVVEGKNIIKYTNNHRGILSYLLTDCGDLKTVINNIRINEKELTKLIEQYNTCKGEPSITFKAKKSWFRASAGLGAGFVISNIDLNRGNLRNDYLTSNYSEDYSLTYGADFLFNSPRLNERIAFYTGVYYLNSHFNTSSTYDFETYTDRNTVTINLQQLKIPAGIRYTLTRRKLSPYLNVGISTTRHLSSSSQRVRETERNNQIETYESDALVIRPNQLGYWCGIGIKPPINAKIKSSFELRYERTNGIGPKESNLSSTLSNINFIVGISF